MDVAGCKDQSCFKAALKWVEVDNQRAEPPALCSRARRVSLRRVKSCLALPRPPQADQVAKVEKMRQSILEGLTFSRPPHPLPFPPPHGMPFYPPSTTFYPPPPMPPPQGRGRGMPGKDVLCDGGAVYGEARSGPEPAHSIVVGRVVGRVCI